MLSATSLVTTEPAPTLAFSPMVKLGKIVEFAPMVEPLPTIVGGSSLHLPRDGAYLSFVKTTPGPINTLSSMITFSGMNTPYPIETLEPIFTLLPISE